MPVEHECKDSCLLLILWLSLIWQTAQASSALACRQEHEPLYTYFSRLLTEQIELADRT